MASHAPPMRNGRLRLAQDELTDHLNIHAARFHRRKNDREPSKSAYPVSQRASFLHVNILVGPVPQSSRTGGLRSPTIRGIAAAFRCGVLASFPGTANGVFANERAPPSDNILRPRENIPSPKGYPPPALEE